MIPDRHKPGITPQQADQITRRRQNIPKKYAGHYDKAVKGNRPAAVKAFCLECVGWIRTEITLCTDLACPLYVIRPFRNLPANPLNRGVHGRNKAKSGSEAPKVGSELF